MKKIIMAFLLILVIAGGFYVNSLLNSKPPLPIIRAGHENVAKVRGSYCWEGLISSECVDTIPPPELIKSENLTPVIASPSSKLKIVFKNEPKKNTISVSKWLTNNQVEDVELNKNTIVLPQEKGIYVYDVSANWEKGSASYAFAIEIR
ncbi:hypothetical protein [Rummeliibacillus stabekisii]|uniref:hypothetical protein n=1 Tax=Rummeliibacillus stabekisii TaxID=241244 RepID=UPI00370FDEB6